MAVPAVVIGLAVGLAAGALLTLVLGGERWLAVGALFGMAIALAMPAEPRPPR
jgi:hypothetical protein